MKDDPFERAAEREEHEEIRREMRRTWMWGRRGRSGTAVAVVVFGIPYIVWGLLRAATYDFGEPTVPQSMVRFFFGEWWWFGAMTGWLLFLIWATAIEVVSARYRDD
jgi:hypothetical protein